MEVNKIDARPLIFLNDEDYDCLCSGIKDFQIVSDFFKQERLKAVEVRARSENLFRYKVTPFAVAAVAIAYPFYESSPQSISAFAAWFAMFTFLPFAGIGIQDLWKGGSFAGEELRLSNGNITTENGSIIINQTPELNFKEYFKNKNLPEEDFELLLAHVKRNLPIDQNKMFFSTIESTLKKDESDLNFLFNIPFAKHNDRRSQFPNEIWELIAAKASLIYLQSQEA